MAPEKAREEYEIGRPLLNINKTQAYSLPAVHQCRVKPSAVAYADGSRIPSINACRNTHVYDLDKKKDPLAGIRTANAHLLFYKDGGADLERKIVYVHELRPFFRSLQNLFDGLATLHANDYVHLDIKPPNITVELTRGGTPDNYTFIPRFIDFGLGSRIKDWLKHLTAPVESFPADAVYIYWPPELHFFQVGALFDTMRNPYAIKTGARTYRARTLEEQIAEMNRVMANEMKNDKLQLEGNIYNVSPRVLYNAAGIKVLENTAARDTLYTHPFLYLVDNRHRDTPGVQAFRDWLGGSVAEDARQWFAQFDGRDPKPADLDFDAPDEPKKAVLDVLRKILKGVDMWSMGFVLSWCLRKQLGFKPIRIVDGRLTFSIFNLQTNLPIYGYNQFIEEFFRDAIKPAYELVEGLCNLDYKARLTADQAKIEYARVNKLLATYMKRPEFNDYMTRIGGYRSGDPAATTVPTPVAAAVSPSPHQLNYGVAENYGENIGGLFANAPAGVKPGRIVRGYEEDIEIFGKNIGGLFENAREGPPGAVYPVRPGAARVPMSGKPPLRRSTRRVRKLAVFSP
jgi:serine/threonine protein kinase